MTNRFDQIRDLLAEIENESPGRPAADEHENALIENTFTAFELPQIIQEIVDDLQPLLEPYEIAFYWYAFRHSIGRTGNPLIRLSTRKMQKRA